MDLYLDVDLTRERNEQRMTSIFNHCIRFVGNGRFELVVAVSCFGVGVLVFSTGGAGFSGGTVRF